MDESVPSWSKPPCFREDAVAVVKRLGESGHVAYFAGGCVRDLLLGSEPKDFDVATDAPPNRVRELFRHTQAVGAAFGVILARVGRSVVEVATFRTDGKYVDGRRPETVAFSTAEEDAKRRDFTINGLFLDPLKPGTIDEQLIDYVGGRRDLHDRILRAIGDPDARFGEDYLRLLRAVRFAARFGLEIEPGTAAAITEHAPRLRQISPERVAEELRLMLTPPTRASAYHLLERFDLVRVILRPVAEEIAQGSGEDCQVFQLLAPGRPIPFALALAGLFVDSCVRPLAPRGLVHEMFERAVAQKASRIFRQTLKISNDESDELIGILCGIAPLLKTPASTLATRKRFLARSTSAASVELLTALRGAGLLRAEIDSILSRLEELEGVDPAPVPLITGDDLVTIGLAPGPMFRAVLDRTYDEQLEGRISSKEAATAFAVGWMSAKSGTEASRPPE